MKDFKEFEELLASDECQAEWKAIRDGITNSCIDDGDDARVFASFVAMEKAHFELRKYHEWINC